MKFVKQDKEEELIEFYLQNGLEFDDDKGYLGNKIQSFIIQEEENTIGAVSISIYQNKNFIEALAVDKKYRNQGYGTMLLKKAIAALESPIYTISKADKFYLKHGFVYDHADLIDKVCKTCKYYQVSCFPRVMRYTK